MTNQTIGFIGLGLMGTAMVERLLDKGHGVTVLGNRNRSGIEAVLARGASEAADAAALARASDVVMLCMGTSEQVEGRMLGEQGVIAGLAPGSVVIDFGTSLPGSTKMLGEKVAAAGSVMLDAPIGRTPSHARDGLLNLMCSGDRETFDRVRPLLDDLGENVFHLGALGSGHTIKLINNFFAMTTANAMSEAFAMADLAGIPRQNLYDVMSAGPVHSGMMDFVKAYAIDGNPQNLAFSVRNAAKDVGYYVDMAAGLGADSVMSACANRALQEALKDGRADDLVPQMVDFYTSRYGG